MTTALSMPMIFGDERDSILAKFNQIQSLWGAGKGYYTGSQQPITFTMDNPFCRFKVGIMRKYMVITFIAVFGVFGANCILATCEMSLN